jgi:outer membrane murein-binding lipoprotein Lpp
LSTLVLLAGCASSQVVQLEQDHERLRTEYNDLQQNVTALSNQMVEMGLITQAQANARANPDAQPQARRGPAPGHGNTNTELSKQLPWTAERTGTPRNLPAAGQPERADDDCGWRLNVRELQPISDFPLNRDGYGKSSPVVLSENGAPMVPHAMPEAFQAECTGSYRHAGYLFLFSPTGIVGAAMDNSYTLSLDEDFPLPRGEDDRPMYWVYPGTTATFSFTGGWKAEWGEPELNVSGRVLDVDAEGASVVAPGINQPLVSPGEFHVSKPLLEGAEGDFEVVVRSPGNGPYLILDVLTVGNAEFAAVVTAPNEERGQ